MLLQIELTFGGGEGGERPALDLILELHTLKKWSNSVSNHTLATSFPLLGLQWLYRGRESDPGDLVLSWQMPSIENWGSPGPSAWGELEISVESQEGQWWSLEPAYVLCRGIKAFPRRYRPEAE